MVDTNYTRIIPRDLFNEAKLLKCIGRLCLLLHDYTGSIKIISALKIEHDGDPFVIGQLFGDGALTITNLKILIRNIPVCFKSKYNSKDNYTLVAEFDEIDYLVFDEEGNFTDEFREFVQSF